MNAMTRSRTVAAFTDAESRKAKLLLAAKVASMMGRKMEEDDWTSVYCRAKGIPESSWSNLNVDVMHRGLGVEHKLLRCSGLGERSIMDVCGTTKMHPAATRSIRIADVGAPADVVATEVLKQYNSLIDARSDVVRETEVGGTPDMRIGWLLWEDALSEFLYFEEVMRRVDPGEYYATWNETPPRGARKGSRSLWIFRRETQQKRFSVTTSAGIKIQPYFDVPSPTDPNLYYWRVQSEAIDGSTVIVWVSARTAREIERELGMLTRDVVSRAIIEASSVAAVMEGDEASRDDDLAVAIKVSTEAFEVLCTTWNGVSDEHRAQLFLDAVREYHKGV